MTWNYLWAWHKKFPTCIWLMAAEKCMTMLRIWKENEWCRTLQWQWSIWVWLTYDWTCEDIAVTMVQLSDGIWIWLTSYDGTYEGIAVTMAQLSNGMKYDCVMAYEYDWLMIEHWGHCSDNGPIEYALKYDCWKMQDIVVTMVQLSVSEGILRTLQCQWSNWRMHMNMIEHETCDWIWVEMSVKDRTLRWQ